MISALVAVTVIVVATMCWTWVKQMDHTRRLERRQLGLPELPRIDKSIVREQIPKDVRKLIEPWDSAVVRRHLEDECHALRQQGVPWSEIKRTLAEQ